MHVWRRGRACCAAQIQTVKRWEHIYITIMMMMMTMVMWIMMMMVMMVQMCSYLGCIYERFWAITLRNWLLELALSRAAWWAMARGRHAQSQTDICIKVMFGEWCCLLMFPGTNLSQHCVWTPKCWDDTVQLVTSLSLLLQSGNI